MRYYLRNREKNLQRHWRAYEPYAWGVGEERGMVRIETIRPLLSHLRQEMTCQEIAEKIGCYRNTVLAWTDCRRGRKQMRIHRKYAVALVKLAYEHRIQSSPEGAQI
jgi:hypothetical protein